MSGNSGEKRQRWRVLVSGRVQGVGFRYTTCRVAGSMGITGWVRNRSDGQVEMLVEGDRVLLQQLLERVRESTRGEICGWEIEKSEPLNEFDDFSIRF
jgi:acylphosphatase